jgi:hypothetical protein
MGIKYSCANLMEGIRRPSESGQDPRGTDKMTRTCTICNHKEVDEINKLLLTGESYRNIAKLFEASESAVYRHKEGHIPELLSKSKDIQETINANSLICQIEDIRDTIKSLLKQAIETDNLRDAHNFVGDTLQQIELEAKLYGQIQQSINVNLQQQQIKFSVSFSDPLPSKFEE